MQANSVSSKIIRGSIAASIAFGSMFAIASPAHATTGLCAANSDSADEEWIDSLTVGSASPVVDGQSNTYFDATASTLGTYAAGSTGNQISTQITVDMAQAASGEIWDENVFIWLDLNQDGQVDLSNELIYSDSKGTDTFTQPDPTNQPSVYTMAFDGTFDVPADAFNGDVVGRVMLQYVDAGSDPILCNDDPNAFIPGVSAYEYGATLDFKIAVTGGVDNPAAQNNAVHRTLANTGVDAAATNALVASAISLLAAGVLVLARLRRKH